MLTSCNSGGGGDENTAVEGEKLPPTTKTGCLSSDSDGDGILDCEDPDIDNDNIVNEQDAFPFNPLESKDTDGDRVGDNTDVFINDPDESGDLDLDSLGDNADPDDDNDGVIDVLDDLSSINAFFFDIDKDNIGDGGVISLDGDPDNDNDGIPNILDDFLGVNADHFDLDGDLLPNLRDNDMDNDGVSNLVDAFAYDSTEQIDSDEDSLGNNIDPDDDNDGFPDGWEEFSTVRLAIYDSDKDTIENKKDKFPDDPQESKDTDNDGVGDNADVFPTNPLETADLDRDGKGDNSDNDIDGDFVLNCIPVTDTLPNCNFDALPFDKDDFQDVDGDLIGDSQDVDDDNDGIPDAFDTFSKDNRSFSDIDGDLVPDNYLPQTPEEEQTVISLGWKVFIVSDPDLDNDGVPNYFDDIEIGVGAFDIDNDGIGNVLDDDDDGDSVLDVADLFPFDPEESGDFDGDLLGDAVDPDDDNDGTPDKLDDLSKNNKGFADLDNDKIPNIIDSDLDGDGFEDGPFVCDVYNNSLVGIATIFNDRFLNGSICGRLLTSDKDLFPYDGSEAEDDEMDGIGNNADPDDDNDGVPDIFDDLPSFLADKWTNSFHISYGFFDIDKDGKQQDNPAGLSFDIDIDNDGRKNDEEAGTTFQFDPEEVADTDGDLIGDNNDDDIDNDGFINCKISAGLPEPFCDLDDLPFVGRTHPFVTARYQKQSIDTPYCSGDCFAFNADTDGDNLTNFIEFELGTNPSVKDTDGDGFDDDVEVLVNKTDPNVAEPIVIAAEDFYTKLIATPDGGNFNVIFEGDVVLDASKPVTCRALSEIVIKGAGVDKSSITFTGVVKDQLNPTLADPNCALFGANKIDIEGVKIISLQSDQVKQSRILDGSIVRLKNNILDAEHFRMARIVKATSSLYSENVVFRGRTTSDSNFLETEGFAYMIEATANNTTTLIGNIFECDYKDNFPARYTNNANTKSSCITIGSPSVKGVFGNVFFGTHSNIALIPQLEDQDENNSIYYLLKASYSGSNSLIRDNRFYSASRSFKMQNGLLAGFNEIINRSSADSNSHLFDDNVVTSNTIPSPNIDFLGSVNNLFSNYDLGSLKCELDITKNKLLNPAFFPSNTIGAELNQFSFLDQFTGSNPLNSNADFQFNPEFNGWQLADRSFYDFTEKRVKVDAEGSIKTEIVTVDTELRHRVILNLSADSSTDDVKAGINLEVNIRRSIDNSILKVYKIYYSPTFSTITERDGFTEKTAAYLSNQNIELDFLSDSSNILVEVKNIRNLLFPNDSSRITMSLLSIISSDAFTYKYAGVEQEINSCTVKSVE